jgi:hypothetical protein
VLRSREPACFSSLSYSFQELAVLSSPKEYPVLGSFVGFLVLGSWFAQEAPGSLFFVLFVPLFFVLFVPLFFVPSLQQ